MSEPNSEDRAKLEELMKIVQAMQSALMPHILGLFPQAAIMTAVIFPADGKVGILFGGNTPQTKEFIDFVRESYLQNIVGVSPEDDAKPRIILQ